MASEIWDLYDAYGRKTDKTMRRGEEVPAGFYHQVVHIWPINSKGEYLVQRRSPYVQWKPNCWATTGGSAIAGEDVMTAARRELREELGYHAQESEMRQIACLRRSNSFCNVFVILINRAEDEFILQKEEVSAVRWCDSSRLLQMVAENTLYNYGDNYFRMLLNHRSKR